MELQEIDPADITALVVLDRRDKQALYRSMQKQATRENMDYPAEKAYEEISSTLKDYLQRTGIEHLFVYTEELDDRIGEILAYLDR